jgi:hypothetical protein
MVVRENSHLCGVESRISLYWKDLTDVETTPVVVRRRDRVPRYKREFDRVSGAFFFTSTHETQGQTWSPTRQSLWVQELQTCVSLHETHFECLLGSSCLTSIILPCSTVCVCVCVRVCVCVCVQERQKETEEGTSTREHKSIWSLNNSTFLLSNMYLISLSGWQRIFETNPS